MIVDHVSYTVSIYIIAKELLSPGDTPLDYQIIHQSDVTANNAWGTG